MIALPVRCRYPQEVPALVTEIAGAVLLLASLLLATLGGSRAIASGGGPYPLWRARSTPKFDLRPVCPRSGHPVSK